MCQKCKRRHIDVESPYINCCIIYIYIYLNVRTLHFSGCCRLLLPTCQKRVQPLFPKRAAYDFITNPPTKGLFVFWHADAAQVFIASSFKFTSQGSRTRVFELPVLGMFISKDISVNIYIYTYNYIYITFIYIYIYMKV